MEYYVLASGSKGNATLIKGKDNYLLIDFGISKRELVSKISALNIHLDNIVGVLFTHAHPDHCQSPRTVLNTFAKNKIYCSRGIIEVDNQNYLDPLNSFEIAEFKIMTLPLSHDSPCLGYLILVENEKLVYITDTGYLNYKLFPLIKDANHYLLESNYDEGMLLASNRSSHLKKRILSPLGHLSNEDAGNILKENIGNNTKSICLMHISRECNTKDLAVATIKNILEDAELLNDSYSIEASDQNEVFSSDHKTLAIQEVK